ncbi:MAG TPA: MT-A70 family methyltransferase [Anaerolineae bacterium]|nr:MT-A70 family methyltransferase [Anaerolineae bacterium]
MFEPYQLIYVDPPWQYRDQCHAGQRGAGYKYDLMSLAALKALDVGKLADPSGCLLALWWVPPMPQEALDLVKAWGFTLKTMQGFTWHKTTKYGKDHFGMGNYTRSNAECCLFATVGKPKRLSAGVRSLVVAQVGAHSAKPPEVRERLVALLGNVRRIEIFAREISPGWDAVGSGVNGLDITVELERIIRCDSGTKN